MNVALDAPRRPALRYYGGKWRLSPWIISHFPSHECYVEPFGGGASVLLNKPRSPLEIYNDLNGQVVNFFAVLREQSDKLIRAIELTPWARAEYELSQEIVVPNNGNRVEAARRFYISCWMGFGGGVLGGGKDGATRSKPVRCGNRAVLVSQRRSTWSKRWRD